MSRLKENIIMNNFLLTYSVPDPNGTGKINLYKWFENEDELHCFVIEKKKLYPNGFVINEAMEVLDYRQIFTGGDLPKRD